MIRISVYDVDRTLTRAPTYSAFLLFAAWHAAPWRLSLIPLIVPWAIAYALKALSRRRMKEIMHNRMLGRGLSRRTAEQLALMFSKRLVERGLYTEGLEQIAADRASGRRIMLATAAPDLYIKQLAAMLLIDDVIATVGTWKANLLTDRIDGENCYGHAKLTMIEDYLRSEAIDRSDAHIRFYSDHVSDLPTFEWADEQIAVNPSKRLRNVAAARGWKILCWSENSDAKTARFNKIAKR